MSKKTPFNVEALAEIAGVAPNANMCSCIAGLEARGGDAGLLSPHRLAQYMAQLVHESARFRYDREIWDGKGAQARYDTRTDLGNTPQKDGDGYLYRGRTAIQITGKANTGEFRDWCRQHFDNVPDFVEDPDAMNADPWEGLGPIWYWETRDLNRFADEGNIEMVTRRINGGLNGYADRLKMYDRSALVLLGFGRAEVRRFQDFAGIVVDGQSGPQTRASMHLGLKSLAPVTLPSTVVAPLAAPESHAEAVVSSSLIAPEDALIQIAEIVNRTSVRPNL